jgi:SAM-dependent methyltransferase
MERMAIVPDAKDWTWVLDRPCPECGFDAATVDPAGLADALRDNAAVWVAVLADPAASARPTPDVWSPLEYACHVRDVHRVFLERVTAMLAEDEPRFENWDQDATAVDDAYAEQEPTVVGREVVEAADAVAEAYASVAGQGWSRRGVRSNGSEFTVESLGRYHLHDVVHHAHDVAGVAQRATVAAYDASAAEFRDGTAAMPDSVSTTMDDFVSALPRGARVLEVGSGPGRDAAALEWRGVSVRRTDVSPGFVRLLREAGHEADVVDPLTDDLADPQRDGAAYDGVWANACLLHVARGDLPTVLARLAAVTGPGGALRASFKEGDGEGWSTHGHVAAPRFFVLWREEPLRAACEGAGWRVAAVHRVTTSTGQPWLDVEATRR